MYLAKKVFKDLVEGLAKRREDEQRVRLIVHRAAWHADGRAPGRDCWFVTATNTTASESVEITAVWLESAPRRFVERRQRRLPVTLRPGETWDTWIETEKLPETVRDEAHALLRVRLGTGTVLTPQRA
jgi:hypothetical protein